MYSGKRKLIGVFVNNMDNAFQPEVCVAVSRITHERGYDAAIFNSFGNVASSNVYENLEIKLIDLAPIEKMDAIITLTDTFGIYSQRYYMLEQIKNRRRSDCPVINLRGGIRECNKVFGRGNYFSIGINEKRAYESLIEHVIIDHGVKNPCFLSGPEGHEDADSRRDCFLRICERNGVKLKDNAIFYGDFWRNKTEKAIEYFYSDPHNEPDAIICANDYMAVDMIMGLYKHGKRVPEDVIVTGFDNLPESNSCFPPLTTMGVMNSDMVNVAIKMAENYWNGIDQPTECRLEPNIKKRGSCGCNNTDLEGVRYNNNRLLRNNYDLYNHQMSLAYTYMGMSGCRNMRDIIDAAKYKVMSFDDCRNFYLFLCTDTGDDDIPATEFSNYFKDKLSVIFSVNNGKQADYYDLPEKERVISKNDLLPDIADSDEPTCYYYIMLHNKECCFGYTAISFDNYKIYDFNYECWMISYSVGLTEMINRAKLEKALQLNEIMSVTDALTKLLNRRGFEDQAFRIINGLNHETDEVCVMSIDLDGLKQINDNYGHAEGDYAIRAIGEAIVCLTGDRGIAARMGGDEFMVLRPLEKNDKRRHYDALFEDRLIEINKKAKKPYNISASIGMEFGKAENYKKLEELIRQSDEKLYAAKRRLRRRESDSDTTEE